MSSMPSLQIKNFFFIVIMYVIVNELFQFSCSI